MLKTLKYFLLLITFASASTQQFNDQITSINNSKVVNKMLCTNIDNTQDQDSDTNNDLTEFCKELFTDVAQIEMIRLVVSIISTITHERGHAVATESLFEVHTPSQIHIGTTTPETTPRLFSLGNMHFYKNIPLKGGLTKTNIKLKKDCPTYNNIGLGIISITGSISDIVMMYALLSAITGYCAYCDNKDLSEITLKSFVNATSPFSYILNTKALSFKQKRLLLNATLVICFYLIFEFFYGCTPYIPGDGMKVWEKNMGITGTPLKIAHVLSTLGAWYCWMFLIKKYHEARKKLWAEDSQIAESTALIALLLMRNRLIANL